MRRPRSRAVIVVVLSLAYPILVIGLGATAFVLSALVTREDGPGEFGDFDEGGALIFALLLALPVVLVLSNVAWAALATWLLPWSQPAGVVGTVVLLAMVATGMFAFLGAGVGPVNPNGWTHVALAAASMSVWAALAASWLTRSRHDQPAPPESPTV